MFNRGCIYAIIWSIFISSPVQSFQRLQTRYFASSAFNRPFLSTLGQREFQLSSSPAFDSPSTDINGNTTASSDTNINNDIVIVPSLFGKIKSIISGNGIKGLAVNKESISKLGLNVLLAYGFVSNVSYITCLILAWVTHGKNTGLSPLVAGVEHIFYLLVTLKCF